MNHTVTLFGTLGCHLCDQAREMIEFLNENGVTDIALTEVDIIEDDGLYERYGLRIPVLRRQSDGGELDWPFEPTTIMQFVGQ